jgi:hypothetical protein
MLYIITMPPLVPRDCCQQRLEEALGLGSHVARQLAPTPTSTNTHTHPTHTHMRYPSSSVLQRKPALRTPLHTHTHAHTHPPSLATTKPLSPSLSPRSGLASSVFDLPWVPPVGGAPSRHTSTWEVHATGVHRRGRVAPRRKQLSKQLRRCQAGRTAEEMRGPPAGAHRRGEDSPLSRSADLDPIRGKRSWFAFRGDWKFHLKQSLPRRGSSFGDLTTDNCLAICRSSEQPSWP